ncbi:MAG: glycosyl hydrolase, partial [Planctomycetota bacterium]|nr:glycosyl hydrolase [Planctomycetota bacterium]
MYFSEGINPNEIGDFDVIEHEDRLHVFYLVLPTHDSVGHLVSDDGINWTQLPDAIRTGDPGEFDADQIWTMGVGKASDGWIMLYTANEENGTIQTTGLASSDDLIHWTKAENNPVARPDPRWYEAEQSGNYRIDWRDPQIVEHGGKF